MTKHTLIGPKRDAVAGNTATGILKLLALAFMICDHTTKSLRLGVREMEIIGRMAFPIYCWCLVVGFHYTRSVPRYALRLLLVGVFAQPVYALAMNHEWYHLNIFFALCIALLGLWAIRERAFGSHIWGPVLALILAQMLCGDYSYGWKGVLFIFLLYAARRSRPAIAAVMVAFCLFWGQTSSTLTSVCGLDLAALTKARPWNALLSPWLKLQAMAVLSLPLIVFPFPARVRFRLPAWVGYMVYPLHLAVLGLIKALTGRIELPWWLPWYLPTIPVAALLLSWAAGRKRLSAPRTLSP